MKRQIPRILLGLAILILIGNNIENITNKVADMLGNNPKVIINEPNQYYKNIDYLYVKESTDFVPYSMQDIKNIFYTILNRGYESFTFYCPDAYLSCIEDINSLSVNKSLLTHINNFVSPFNNFSSINITTNASGEVNVSVIKLYKKSDIDFLNTKMDSIINETINDTMHLEDKVLAFHDYIINHTKYDVKKEEGISVYNSTTAIGALIEGYSVCGGYADAMALFLNYLGVENYKVASETHIWNAIKINDEWFHLDLTWDDPVTENSDIDTLLHKFYLIKSEKLEGYNITDHDYDKTIYQELNS